MNLYLKLINIYLYKYLHICVFLLLYVCEINNKGEKNEITRSKISKKISK